MTSCVLSLCSLSISVEDADHKAAPGVCRNTKYKLHLKKQCNNILSLEQECPDLVLEGRNVPGNSVLTLFGQKTRLGCGPLGLVTSALECWHHHSSDVLLNVKSVTTFCILPAKTDQNLWCVCMCVCVLERGAQLLSNSCN